MSHLQFLDELIREYLLFRGFSSSLKAFDAELKVDKDKGFRVDRVVDQLLHYINTYDLLSLRELWYHLDHRMFSKCEQDYVPAVRKLESSLFKYYLINAVNNSKQEKVVEFFNKMTPEIQGQPEWKDWFMLPYVKNPEEHPTFAMHFSKQWQDTLMVSIHNFLAIIYQVMPQPVLSSYEEEATKLRKLQEENENLKHKLATLTQCSSAIPDTVPPMDIMDDFYIIAQENPTSSENQVGKTLKSVFINAISGGMPTSPVMGRKPQDEQYGLNRQQYSSKSRQVSHGGFGKHSSTESVPKRSLSLDSRSRRAAGRDMSLENVDRRGSSKKDTFLLLSQDKMGEHKLAVTQCRFNAAGSLVASCDLEGVIKVWSATPATKVLSTMQYNDALVALNWVAKNERYFVTGSENGVIRLHDSKENKTLWEIGGEDSVHLKDAQVLSICCSPTECSIACTVKGRSQGNGKLLLFDIKTRKLERLFQFDEMEAGLVSDCCTYNHNGALIVAGCSDGQVRTLDLRHSEVLDSWEVHEGPVTSVQPTPDHNACYTMGDDHKLSRLSMTQNGDSCWSAMLPKCQTSHGTQGFSLHQTGKHVLTACGHTGANIFQLTPGGMQLMLHLGGHRSSLVACDWTTANQCTTCLSASSDGKIKVSTILTP